MKKFYVTTAIPYVNAKPHIGNAMDFMMADVLARYHRLLGDDVFFQVGTDEHGTKIAAKAHEAGLDPVAYADQMVKVFYDFFKALAITHTDVIRTSEPRHEKAAQLLWTQLGQYIYKSKYEGWYCVGCEAFVTDQQATANGGVCPDHKTPYQRLSEENYFFKLSAFGGQIKQALAAGELKIVPKFREAEILQLIESGLEDISVSRPKKHLAWGVPVPGDDTQVMYVWFEALMNYLTILGYPDGPHYQKFWSPDVQLVGKDILRFHAAIWPAMLIALDLPLPKSLLVHGMVNVNGTKMSKTLGNVVDPLDLIAGYGVDAMRYYFLRHIPTVDDGDFTWERFETAYNNELANELGNLVQRIASMITRYQEGVIGDVPRPRHDTGMFHEEMRALRFDRALDYIWLKIRDLNVYLEEVKPWQVAKQDDSGHLQEILGNAVSNIRQIAELLAPFLPATSAAIEKIFATSTVAPYKGVLFPKIYNHTPAPGTPRLPKPAATSGAELSSSADHAAH